MKSASVHLPSSLPVTERSVVGTAMTPWLSNQLAPALTSLAADPFDLGWAERATEMAKGQLAASVLPGSPSGIPPAPPPVPSPSSVCTNPFLDLPSDKR